VKKTLQIPPEPLMAGSSPLWMQTDATLNEASLLQNPERPEVLSAWQSLGQKEQFTSSFNGPVKELKFRGAEVFSLFLTNKVQNYG